MCNTCITFYSFVGGGERFVFFNKHIDFALFCSTLTLDKRLIDAAIVCAIFSKYNF